MTERTFSRMSVRFIPKKRIAAKVLPAVYWIWPLRICGPKGSHRSIWSLTTQDSTRDTDGNSFVWFRVTVNLISPGCISIGKSQSGGGQTMDEQTAALPRQVLICKESPYEIGDHNRYP